MSVSNEEKEENGLILDISGKIRNNYSVRGKAASPLYTLGSLNLKSAFFLTQQL